MSIISTSSIAFPGGYENGFAFPFGYSPPILRGPGDVVYTTGTHQVNPFGIHTQYSTFFKTDYVTGIGIVGALNHVFSPGLDTGVVTPDRGIPPAVVADDLGRLWFKYDSFLLGDPPGNVELAPTDSSGSMLFTITIPRNQHQPFGFNGMDSFVDNGINYVGGLAFALNDAFDAIATNLILFDAASGSIRLNVSIPAPGGQAWIDFATAVPWVLSDGLGNCYALSFERTSNSSLITGSWIFKFSLATGGYTVYSYPDLYAVLMDYTNKQILGYAQNGSIRVIDCATMNVINVVPGVAFAGKLSGVLGGDYSRGTLPFMFVQMTTNKGPIADPQHCSFLVPITGSMLRRLHLPDFTVLDDLAVTPPPVATVGQWLYLYGEQALIWTDTTPNQWQLSYSPSVCTGGQRSRVWIST